MHAQSYSKAPANSGRGRGRTSGGKRPVAVQIVRDLLHSRSGSGSGCITDQSYFWIANRVYQSWLLRFRQYRASEQAAVASNRPRLFTRAVLFVDMLSAPA